MSKQTFNEKIANCIPLVDIPSWVFAGTIAGFLVTGFIICTIGTLMDLSWITFCAGLMSIAISVIVGLIAWLYWWLVPRKSGVIMPALSGAGLILALMSFFSAAMLSAELYVWFTF